MKFSNGYEVPQSESIFEEYQILKKQIIANVSVDKMETLIIDFIACLAEPCFFILELPLNEKEEQRIRNKESDPFHKEIYYIDGCTKEKLSYIFSSSKELLIQDGLSSFGFASHKTKDEIFASKYNVVTIYSKKPKKYTALLEKVGLKRTKKLITAWDTFTEYSPGCSKEIKINGKNVYDLPELYEGYGMYKAEIREDW